MVAKEAELCEALMKRAREEGWIVYPETAGFDILLVATEKTKAAMDPKRIHRSTPIEAGDMIGVEAKLSANVQVLSQAIDNGYASRHVVGPDFRVALVKKATGAFRHIARVIGVGVWTLETCTDWRFLHPCSMRWEPKRRPQLPEIIPTGPAGTPSPRRLTAWRIKALKLCIRLEACGFITTTDFRELKLDKRIWIERWLQSDGKVGRLTRYRSRPSNHDFPTHGFEAELELLRKKIGDS